MSWISFRLCAKNGAGVLNSPSTSAWLMNTCARLGRVHRAVMHALLRVDDQAIQRAAFPRRHLRRLFLPVRIVVVALDQMRADLLQPLRLDARDAARV